MKALRKVAVVEIVMNIPFQPSPFTRAEECFELRLLKLSYEPTLERIYA